MSEPIDVALVRNPANFAHALQQIIDRLNMRIAELERRIATLEQQGRTT